MTQNLRGQGAIVGANFRIEPVEPKELSPRSSDEPSKLKEPDQLYERPFGGLILPRGTTEFTSSIQRVPLHLYPSKALSFKESFEPL